MEGSGRPETPVATHVTHGGSGGIATPVQTGAHATRTEPVSHHATDQESSGTAAHAQEAPDVPVNTTPDEDAAATLLPSSTVIDIPGSDEEEEGEEEPTRRRPHRLRAFTYAAFCWLWQAVVPAYIPPAWVRRANWALEEALWVLFAEEDRVRARRRARRVLQRVPREDHRGER